MKYDHAPLHDSSACQQRYKTCEHEQCRRYVHYADGWKEQIVVVVNICDGLFSSNVFRQIGYPVSECSHEKMQCRGGRDIHEPCVFDECPRLAVLGKYLLRYGVYAKCIEEHTDKTCHKQQSHSPQLEIPVQICPPHIKSFVRG